MDTCLTSSAHQCTILSAQIQYFLKSFYSTWYLISLGFPLKDPTKKHGFSHRHGFRGVGPVGQSVSTGTGATGLSSCATLCEGITKKLSTCVSAFASGSSVDDTQDVSRAQWVDLEWLMVPQPTQDCVLCPFYRGNARHVLNTTL